MALLLVLLLVLVLVVFLVVAVAVVVAVVVVESGVPSVVSTVLGVKRELERGFDCREGVVARLSRARCGHARALAREASVTGVRVREGSRSGL